MSTEAKPIFHIYNRAQSKIHYLGFESVIYIYDLHKQIGTITITPLSVPYDMSTFDSRANTTYSGLKSVIYIKKQASCPLKPNQISI